MRMLRLMCDVTKLDRIKNVQVEKFLRVKNVAKKSKRE